MRALSGLVGVFALVFLAPGCVGSDAWDDEEEAGEVDPAIVSGNALTPNALTPNALTPNGLTPNGLTPNGLTPNGLTPNALTPNSLSPEAYASLLDPGVGGTLSRMLVKYLVSCALPPDAVFAHTWTDAIGYTHDEAYLGQLGLAPAWAAGPLDPTEQRMVSACALARTNYYGVQVEISMRSPHAPLDATSAAELAAFPVVEGAFWGDLFDAKAPHLRACYASSNVLNSRSWLRDCASGHMDRNGVNPCANIEILGACDDLCAPLDPYGGFYPKCTDPVYGVTDQVITTALPPAPKPGHQGDLTVETSAPQDLVKNGCTPLTQTISVTNTGAVLAPSPLVMHTLSDGLALLGATTTAGSCSGGGKGALCTLTDLAPGASALITIAALPTTTSGEVSSTSFAVAGMGESDVSDNASITATQIGAPARFAWELSSGGFNSAPIAAGKKIWFTVVLKPGSLPTGATRLWALGGRASFSANGKKYTVIIPDSQIAFDSATSIASASYDPTFDRWSILAPKAFSGNVLVSAAAFVVPESLPGGINPVSVSIHFVTDRKGIKPSWSWAAAVYDKLHRDYGHLQVQPTDDDERNPSGNSDRAGTPEAYKSFVIKGARGDGGSNYTGGRTGGKSGGPQIQLSCP